MPLSKLPGWVIDDESSVRAEVAAWVNATPVEMMGEDDARVRAWDAIVSRFGAG